MKTKKKFIMLIGLSGSGKTTYLKNDFLNDFPDVSNYLKDNDLDLSELIVSADDLRRELTGDVNNHEKERLIWASLIPKKLKENLTVYGYTILDATNVSKRKEFLKKFKNVNKYGVIFKPDLELSIERVNEDIKNSVDRSNVPEKAIIAQYERFRNSVIYFQWDGIWNKVIRKKIRERLMKEENFTDIIFVK